MKKNVAIQLNRMKDNELLEHKLALDSIGIIDPIYYSLIADTDEIIDVERFYDYDVVVPFGSTKLLKLWQKGLMPSTARIFYDEARFDQQNYQPLLGEMALNHGAIYSTLGRVKDIPVAVDCFIKPTRDLKAFAGVVVNKGRTPAEEIFSHPQSADLTDEEPILMAPLRGIQREYRNFVVDGRLVDSSIYKIGSNVTHQPVSNQERERLAAFLDEVTSRYQPMSTYVVDFALMDDGSMTVVEYNCLHCSGMYAIDRASLFRAMLDAAERSPS